MPDLKSGVARIKNSTNDARLTKHKVVQEGHTLAPSMPIRYLGGSWVPSQADTPENSFVAGVVLSTEVDSFWIATAGYMEGITGVSVGVNYLSPNQPGKLTTVAPSANIIPVLYGDSSTSGIILAIGAYPISSAASISTSIPAPSSDGMVFCSTPAVSGFIGEWDRTIDIGSNAAGKSGSITILSSEAAGNAVEINGALVTSSGKKLTIREIDICDGGVAKKMLILGSAPY